MRGIDLANIDSMVRLAMNGNPAYKLVTKYGTANVGTSLVPIAKGLFYRTPTAAVTLEVVSTSADDAAGGLGARVMTFVGLDANWDEVEIDVTMSGLTPATFSVDLVRLYRFYVKESGTYGSQSAGSHVGTITIRESGGGDTWALMETTPFPEGQSLIACYTSPRNYAVVLLSKEVFSDASKSVDTYTFKREDASVVSAPYSCIRVQSREIGLGGHFDTHYKTAKIISTTGNPCDVGIMGKVSTGTANISAEFELLLIAMSELN